MADSVLHDSPLEFMQGAANSGECVAQSVIPNGLGAYHVACCCGAWDDEAPTREEGLRMAREHTGHE